MGRHSGYIAVYTALASAAEAVCIPETATDVAASIRLLQVLKQRGKTSVMMIVAEGDETGGAEVLNRQLLKAGCPYPTRVVILGHLQRGGRPTPEDRLLASQLGDHAVRSLRSGGSGVMAGLQGGKCTTTALSETFASHKPIPHELLDLLETLSS
jgi:6-phosphofructokinase 1